MNTLNTDKCWDKKLTGDFLGERRVAEYQILRKD